MANLKNEKIKKKNRLKLALLRAELNIDKPVEYYSEDESLILRIYPRLYVHMDALDESGTIYLFKFLHEKDDDDMALPLNQEAEYLKKYLKKYARKGTERVLYRFNCIKRNRRVFRKL